MKHLTLAALLLGASAISPAAFAQDSELSVSTGVDYVSQYVFRGVSLADDAVQPWAEVDGGVAGSYEVSASVGLGEVPLSPSVSAYYDFTLEAFTLEGGVSHSFAITENNGLDLGLTVGLVDGDGFSYEYGTASASVSHGFTDDVSVYLGVNYTVNSEDALDFASIVDDFEGDDNLFWVGTGVSAGF